MKRLLLLFTVLTLSGVQLANGQCSPDPQYTQPGIYPDSATNLNCAVVDSLYTEIITVVIPVDTVADIGTGPLDFWIDSIELISVSGLPNGIVLAGCSPASCGWLGGTTGCLAVIGTPTTTGLYPLEIITRSCVTAKISNLIKGCQDDTIDYYYINVVERLMLSAATTDPSSCSSNDGAIDLSVTGGTGAGTYEYLWNDQGASTTEDILNLAGGTYMVTVMDSCFTRTLSMTISAAPPPALIVNTTNLTNPTGCTSSDGVIDITVSGGVPPYTYAWNDPATSTTEDISNLAEGTYTVTVTDSCNTETLSATLTAPGNTLAIDTAVVHVSTIGGNDGSIDATVTAGTAPFTYSWDNGETTEDIGTLTAGTYVLTVTDAGGCTKTITVVITEPGVGIQEISVAGFSGLLNIPNPFTNETEIQFSLQGAGSVDFVVYNLIGKVVYSERVNAFDGLNKFQFSSEGLAPGIYIYSLKDERASATGRMIISQK